MNDFEVSGTVKRFPGRYGWHYVEIDEKLSKDFRPIIKDKWPALLSATFRINNTSWDSSIMPMKDGPLFIALPAKVRKSEGIEEGSNITIQFRLNI